MGWKRKLRISSGAADDARRELEAHAVARAEQLMRDGVDEAHAHARARSELGDVDRVARQAQGSVASTARSRLTSFCESLVLDARFAIRSLRRQRTFGIAVILIVGVVVWVVAGVTAIVDAYRLRALPFPFADRVVAITRTPIGAPTMENDAPVPSGLNSIDWPRSDNILEVSAAWEFDGFGLVSADVPVIVPGAWVTPGFFSISGARPMLGRLFDEDDVASGANVAVISHGLWTRQFGSDPGVVGRTIRAYSNDRPDDAEVFEIIGVLDEAFWFYNDNVELLVPLRDRRRPSLARLRAGVSPAHASRHLTEFAAANLPDVDPRWSMEVTPLQQGLYDHLMPSLRVLSWTSFVIFVVATGNILVLLLIRTIRRRHELSVRHAVGARRSRIFRQLAVEGLLLTVIASIAGLVVASWVLDALSPQIQSYLGVQAPGGGGGLRIGAREIGVAAVVCLVVAGLFGVMPAAVFGRGTALLRVGPQSEERRFRGIRDTFVIIEIALSIVLVVGAGLMVQGARHLGAIDVGFRAEELVKGSVALRERSYPEPESRVAFFNRLCDRAARAPGVTMATVTSRYPFQFVRGDLFEADNSRSTAAEQRAVHVTVGPDYFETLDMRIISGRAFTDTDAAGLQPVIIVSETFAERVWPDQNPLGRRVRRGSWKNLYSLDHEPWRTVVGVVSDVRGTLVREEFPETYVPMAQDPHSHMYILARTNTPVEVATLLPEMVKDIDPVQPVAAIETLDDVVRAETSRPRFLTGLLVAFAAFAVCLALAGMYTVVAYAALQRRRELAIRIAIGAQRFDVQRLFLVSGIRSTLIAVVLGIPGAVGLAQVLSAQLEGVPPPHPLLYVLVALLMVMSVTTAVLVPAYRAYRVETATILREL